MNITVTKLTDVELLRKANSFTTGHESHMTLAKAYALGHSPIRTQMWWIELTDIPRFVAQHFERHAVAVIPFGGGDDYPDVYYEKTARIDRGAEDFNDVCLNLGAKVETCWITSIGKTKTEKEIDRAIKECLDCAEEIENLPSRFDRYAPTNLAVICNSESLIALSHTRLCSKASKETREIFGMVRNRIKEIDPDLAKHCVPQCMYRGGICPEPKGCGYNKTEIFNKALTEYKKLFI